MVNNPSPITGLVELKPCPFCGGKARCDIGKMAFEDAEVSCDGCAASGANYDEGFGRDDNTRLAAEAWNTRALSLPQPTIDREAIAREGAEEIVGAMLAAITYSTQPDNVSKLTTTFIEDRARLAMTRILAPHPIDDLSEAKP